MYKMSIGWTIPPIMSWLFIALLMCMSRATYAESMSLAYIENNGNFSAGKHIPDRFKQINIFSEYHVVLLPRIFKEFISDGARYMYI